MTKSIARIAVLVPTYNDGDLLLEAVASIQEDEPVELCVVDDGSTDARSRACLEQLRRKGVHVIRQENQGPAAARTTALRATTAPFVFPLDADDVLEPGVLAKLGARLEATPDAAFAFGTFSFFGDRAGTWYPPRFSAWKVLWANWWSTSVLIRRSALEAVGGWTSDGGYEDWDLFLSFAERGMAAVQLPDAVYRRRLHGKERRQAQTRRRHRREFRRLKERHSLLYGNVRRIVQEERPPLAERALYPLVLGGRPLMPAWLETPTRVAWMRWTALRSRH